MKYKVKSYLSTIIDHWWCF